MSYVSFFLFDGSLLCFECLDCIFISHNAGYCSSTVKYLVIRCMYEYSNELYSPNCVFVRIQEPFLGVYQGCICQECQSRKDSLSTWSHCCHWYTAYLCIKVIRRVVHCKKSCKIWDFFYPPSELRPLRWAAKYLKQCSRWSQNDRRKFHIM
jgi:hypothetical protein